MRPTLMLVLVASLVACSDSSPGDPVNPMSTVTVAADAGSTGSGVVGSWPDGINCTMSGTAETGACSAPFAKGTSVELYALRGQGSRFTGWTLHCSGSGTCSEVNLQDDFTATAAFEPAWALTFDGVQQFAEVADASSLDLAGTWTVEAWIKPDFPAAGIQHMISKWGVTGAASYSFEVNGTALKIATSNGVDPTSVLQADNAIIPGGWQHVAVTFDNGQAILYVDGAKVGESLTMAIPMNSDKPLSFGREGPPLNSYFYRGALDEVRIWNVARSREQILSSYDRVIPVPQAGLVGYWRLDEGNGQVINDLSGSGNDGVLGASTATEASDPSWSSSTSSGIDGQ